MMQQDMITRERIAEMIQPGRRRGMKLAIEWPHALHSPQEIGKDWSLVLPFCETLGNAFDELCSVDHIGLRESKEGRCYTFFKGLEEDSQEFQEIKNCLEIIGSYVAIRDCLAISFAIDYDREGGNPNTPQTRVGALRSLAKPYGGRLPTKQTYTAVDSLAVECLAVLRKLTCYNSATCIVAMPPSDPKKNFVLPKHLVARIAISLGKTDMSDKVNTVRARQESKGLLREEKLANIEGTVEVASGVFKDEVVLLIDDLTNPG